MKRTLYLVEQAVYLQGARQRSLAASSRLDDTEIQKALGGDYTPHDAWQDLGGSREAEQFNMRIIALSDPQHYAALRADAMKEVKDVTPPMSKGKRRKRKN